jgi:nucleoside-diphosphate-sugar epimerase
MCFKSVSFRASPSFPNPTQAILLTFANNLQPAIRGTLEILESAQKAGTVARIVITSSFAALQDYAKGVRPGYTYSVKDWCPLTYEDGKVSSSKPTLLSQLDLRSSALTA